jgi:coenzyme PQQ precursor peptide PqqA
MTPLTIDVRVRARGGKALRIEETKETLMSWTTPVVVEVCAGMEVTAYLPAEM